MDLCLPTIGDLSCCMNGKAGIYAIVRLIHNSSSNGDHRNTPEHTVYVNISLERIIGGGGCATAPIFLILTY